MSETRYQHCSLPVKIWRRRHQLRIPFDTLKSIVYQWRHVPREKRDPWEVLLSIHRGMADFRMHWYYTWDECKARHGIDGSGEE